MILKGSVLLRLVLVVQGSHAPSSVGREICGSQHSSCHNIGDLGNSGVSQMSGLHTVIQWFADVAIHVVFGTVVWFAGGVFVLFVIRFLKDSIQSLITCISRDDSGASGLQDLRVPELQKHCASDNASIEHRPAGAPGGAHGDNFDRVYLVDGQGGMQDAGNREAEIEREVLEDNLNRMFEAEEEEERLRSDGAGQEDGGVQGGEARDHGESVRGLFCGLPIREIRATFLL